MKPSLPFLLNCKGNLLSLQIPKIMGILNLTPDSFSDGGLFFNEKNAMLQVERMVKDGVDIIDIGAQSSRPNATKVSATEEIKRLGKSISLIKKEFPDILISLDSFLSEVVKFGADQGIDWVNDISGGQYDENMLQMVAALQLPYVLMHTNPEYQQMHSLHISDDVVEEVNRYFSCKLLEINALGIKDVILDPGFGFGKTIEQNHQLLDELQYINFGKNPVLVGISRKSFIYKPLGKQPTEIGEETQLLHKKALQNGAKILRVHDVLKTKKTLDFFLRTN
jgi:dihydropteroate synthase